MIVSAINLGMQQEQLGQQSIDSTINNIYKLGMLEAQTRQRAPEQVFVKNAPGYGDLTLDQYKSLPTEDRQYVTHVLSARQRDKTPLSRKEFNSIGDKDKHPASAEAAAIDQLYREYKGTPPQKEIKRIHDLYNTDKDKVPSPVTWTTATQELTKRFGKLDPTGMWAVTPELQWTHRKSQQILTDLKAEGVEPLNAINEAENRAREDQRKLEELYFNYLKRAGKDDDKVEKLKSQFYNAHGYIPVKGNY